MTSNNSNVYDLIQPNLLTKEDLIAHLQHRCIKIDDMGAMSKDQLINLYNRVVTPLEQRITRRTPQSPPNRSQITMECTETTQENVNKKIKLFHTNTNSNYVNGVNHISLKRKSNDIKICNDLSPAKKVRQRICWP